MEQPMLLAELPAAALQEDGNAASNVIRELRRKGELADGQSITWTWEGHGGQTVGRLWLGKPPPRKGDILEIEDGHRWATCLVVVSEVRNWGVIADLRYPNEDFAPIRLDWSDFEVVGRVRG